MQELAMTLECDAQTQFVVYDIEGRVNIGIRDGLAGRAIASDHPAYTAGWEIGERGWRAASRRIVLCHAASSRCNRCGAEYLGHVDQCHAGCRNVGVMTLGALCMYGHREMDDELTFFTLHDLRALAVAGTPIVGPGGEVLTVQLLIQ